MENLTEANYIIDKTTTTTDKGTTVSKKYERIPKKIQTNFKT